jgi:hypothetical protein
LPKRHNPTLWHVTCFSLVASLGSTMPSSPRKKPAGIGRGRSLLVLAQPSGETDDLLAELVGRPDLHMLRVVTLEAAAVALRDVEVSLALVCPETPVLTINALLEQIDRLRPGTPVLAVRDRNGDESPSWKTRAVGVLRAPLLPGVLGRSIDVALGFSSAGDE